MARGTTTKRTKKVPRRKATKRKVVKRKVVKRKVKLRRTPAQAVANPVVSKAKLRKRVKGLIVAAEIRLADAKKLKGKRRQESLRDAYAQAMTARYIAVELLDDGKLEDDVQPVLEQIYRVNPMPGVPGGGIKECIQEMSTRPDVDDPGALCAWIAQQRGEYGWRSLPHISRGGKKSSKELRSVMRRASNPISSDYSNLNDYTVVLAKQLKKLRKDLGLKSMRQNYAGSGSQKGVRQLWATFKNGAVIDIWLERDDLLFGGIVSRLPDGAHVEPTPRRIPYNGRPPEQVYEDALAVLKNWMASTGSTNPCVPCIGVNPGAKPAGTRKSKKKVTKRGMSVRQLVARALQ